MVISPDDECAQSTKHVQVLGVIIDSKLIFSQHVSAMCKKAARQLNALARISNYLDKSARRIIITVLCPAILTTVPLCGIFAESQTAIKLKKYKNGVYE